METYMLCGPEGEMEVEDPEDPEGNTEDLGVSPLTTVLIQSIHLG